MHNYYINTEPQPGASIGDEYEVHREGCPLMPFDREFLGRYENCQKAMISAKLKYDGINGCYKCCSKCYST